MASALRCAVLAAVACAATAQDACGGFETCSDCVSNAFCGWCSPGAVVYKNGTGGRRCADQRIPQWDCPGKYQTDTCEDGYRCDPTNNFTCAIAGPGEGVPKETCDAGCKHAAKVFGCNTTTYKCEEVEPGHQNDGGMEACTAACQVQYTCDKTTFTCKEARNGEADTSPKDQCDAKCKKPDPLYKCNSKSGGIPGNFTCEEATAEEGGNEKATCLEKCVAPKPEPVTPAFLKGLWRGVQINKGYAQGEYDFDFGENKVTVTQPDKTKWEADVFQYMDPGAPADGIKAQVWLQFSAGPASGKTMKGKFDERVSGGDAPETQNVFLGFGKPGSDADAKVPDDADAAMAGSGMTAYVLAKCDPDKPNCEFTPQSWAQLSSHLETEAVTAAGGRQLLSAAVGADACNSHSSCTDCVGDDSCGWCSVPVVYKDGSPGAQCAGFDQAGSSSKWTCPAMYKRTDCGDFLCDAGTFKCREAQPGEIGTLTKSECENECKPVNNTVYVCNQQSYTCEEAPPGTAGADSGENCEAKCIAPPPPPPLKKCNNETKTCEEGCHKGEAGCIDGAVCDEQCSQKPSPPSPPTPPDPITPVAIRGIWRGVGIQNGYKFGEWDVEITDSNATFKNSQSEVWTANVATGGGSPMTITPFDGPNVGKSINCLYTQQEGVETTRMTLAMGLPGGATAPPDYDTAMTPAVGMAELYLVKCKDAGGDDPAGQSVCDFSKSAPHK